MNLTYKVLRKRDKCFPLYKNFFPYIKTCKVVSFMQKNFGHIFSAIEVDNVTGEYKVIIPEAIINEMGWFEDTELKWNLVDQEVIITENTD